MGRLRTKNNAKETIENDKNYIDIDKFSLSKNKEIYLEIGSGKGEFLIQQAIKNNNNIYLGIEKSPTIIWKALNKLHQQKLNLPNLFFTCLNFENIKIKKFKNTITTIFLNFPDPWPKKRHEKRRLVSNKFLKMYKKILKTEAKIEFKTDNEQLYYYCKTTLSKQKNANILFATNNLYKYLNVSKNNNNIQTEYEKKFLNQNKKIHKIIWNYKN